MRRACASACWRCRWSVWWWSHWRVRSVRGRDHLDREDAADDERDAEHHHGSQWFVEEESGDDGHECDTAGRPDAVGDADGHPESQREPQQVEGQQIADDDGNDPRLLAEAVG